MDASVNLHYLLLRAVFTFGVNIPRVYCAGGGRWAGFRRALCLSISPKPVAGQRVTAGAY